MLIDYGGKIDGVPAWRVRGLDTERVYHEIVITGVARLTLRRVEGGGALDVDGVLVEQPNDTAVIISRELPSASDEDDTRDEPFRV